MDRIDARDVVLDLGSEDYYGLWEIVWRLRTLCPDRGNADLMEDARSAMIQLIREGVVRLYLRQTADSEARPLKDDAESVLNDPGNWGEPTSSAPGAIMFAVK